jgi:TonB family protein
MQTRDCASFQITLTRTAKSTRKSIQNRSDSALQSSQMPTRRADRQPLRLAGAVLLLLAPLAPAHAQSTHQAIEARLKGRPLYLRGQWVSNSLQFDIAGVTSSPAISAPFTLCGVDVTRVKLKSDRLEIDGNRVGLEFDQYTPKRVSLQTPIHIEIVGHRDTDYGLALDKIFADGVPALVHDMPFYWQKYAEAHLLESELTSAATQHPNGESAPEDYALRPVKVSPAANRPPQLLDNPEPEFTTAAKILQYRGTSLVHIVVKADGMVGDPYIVRPAGLGLDEEALRAVAHYRFKPATREDGTPLAIDIEVEINFQVGR